MALPHTIAWTAEPQVESRDAPLRDLYATAAAGYLPRLLGDIDRNPYRKTYGCLDRQFWHYRTSDFPSEMYQEGVLPLAQAFAIEFPGNRWRGETRLRELAIAGMRFSARSSHADGSCDDYYPFERALGAAVFSLVAATEAYHLLGLDDEELRAWFRRRADWIENHDESGRLANHHALAALGLARVARATGEDRYARAAEARVRRVLEWQSSEGWFDEYSGADPGYQTVTIDCLAKYRKLTGATWLAEPLGRALDFARLALHPDDSYAGEYGSRGTHHFYPHGMELLAGEFPDAAALAEGFLRALSAGKHAWFEDDRLFAHRLGNLIEAWQDYSPSFPDSASLWCGRPACMEPQDHFPAGETPAPQVPGIDCGAGVPPAWNHQTTSRQAGRLHHNIPGSAWERTAPRLRRDAATPSLEIRHLPEAGLLFVRGGDHYTAVSAARGGVFKHFSAGERPVTDAGLILETSQGRVAVSQLHDRTRTQELWSFGSRHSLRVEGPLHWMQAETASPLKLIIFRLLLLTVGRWCRTLTRKLLQRRLITGRRAAPIQCARLFEWDSGKLTVTDTIELADPRLRIERMSFGVDHQSVYVAASGVYQDGVLEPWSSLEVHLEELNRARRVTIAREFC